ncbi:putative Mg(2+) transport ATPase [Hartmannibacter diazotrophicus]|uniref:Protein MgtC n=1 Tax=Hartmannibacter diazotrophicus TaxID=1482074 RepID=A0A2C9D5Y2_9HYPH|nr:MgtC/SapB family protein [Hartmannibacter diazotrophicus]SON55141.1 putative Mg(2+) transport ATPase [Hartmannibacter diazotrophicus]
MQDIWADITHPTFLPVAVAACRMVLAVVLGSILGLERERHRLSAGLRTHILIALASATAAMVMIEIGHLPAFATDAFRLDAGRLIGAVVSGVAFLAAGLIIYSKGHVFGLTTGAGMWLAAIIGLAVGLGLYVIAIMATGLGYAVLGVLRMVEARLDRHDTELQEKTLKGSHRGRSAGHRPPSRPTPEE